MNIKNLHEGQLIKNYKELCKILEIEEKSSNSKVAQMKELQTYISYEKKGHSFKIIEIYSKKKEKVNNKKFCNRKNLPNFTVSIEDEKRQGVYAIILNKDIYIGSTCGVSGHFRGRFMAHRRGIENFEYTKQMIADGAIFTTLWIAEGSECNKSFIRNKEKEFIIKYDNDPNFNVVNRIKYTTIKKKTKPKKKIKIYIEEADYEKVISILNKNNITFHIKK